jgi:hypothetical protein
MAFKLTDEKHFVNYVNSMLYESQFVKLSDYQKAKLIELYKLCEKHGVNYHTKLTYNLKTSGEINLEPIYFPSEIINSDIKKVCISNNNTGLYFLTNENNNVLYVGKSKNLNNRFLLSYKKINDSEILNVVFMFMPYVNTHILEPYYIMYYKPIHNTDYVFEDNKDLMTIKHDYKANNKFKIVEGESKVFFSWGDFENQYMECE